MQLQEKLSAYIEKRIRGGFYAGAVARVEKSGAAIGDICFGKLGEELAEPMVPDALFSLESISKVACTAPVVLALHEDGILDLDQPLATWFEEFKRDGKEKITPRHLLSHSSGLPDTDEIFLDAEMDPAKLWNEILNTKLQSPPSGHAHYSDLGYLILGYAIEHVTAKSLDVVARERIWHPLGMSSTQFNPPPSTSGRLTSNRGIRGRCVDPVDRALGGIVGCDGVFSTGADLMRFGRMILGNGELDGKRVLTAQSVREFTRNQTPLAKSDEAVSHDFDYLMSARKALGWELPGSRYCHGGTLFSESAIGKVGGTGTFLWIDPEQELVSVYLTNHGHAVPFGSAGWDKMIERVGCKEFFDLVNMKRCH